MNRNVDTYIKTRNHHKTFTELKKQSTKKRIYKQCWGRIVKFKLSGGRFAPLPPPVRPLVSVVV